MKKIRLGLFATLLSLLAVSCAMRHDSCGAYNRGGGPRGHAQQMIQPTP